MELSKVRSDKLKDALKLMSEGQRKEGLLSVLDFVRAGVESGELTELLIFYGGEGDRRESTVTVCCSRSFMEASMRAMMSMRREVDVELRKRALEDSGEVANDQPV